MGPIGIPELIIILIIVLLLFGAKKIPELAKSLGAGIAEFKKGFASKENVKEESGEKEKISGDN